MGETSRRGFMRRTATVAGTTVAIGAGASQVPRFSPIGRAAAHPALILGAVVAVGAAGYIAGTYAGDDVPDTYESTRAFEDHLNIYNDAIEINEVTDSELLASLKRDARNLGDTAREDAVMKMYEAVATGGTRTEAKNAAQTAIDKRFTAPEKALATRVNSISTGILQQAVDRGVLYARNPSDGSTAGVKTIPRASYTFLDGSSQYVYGIGASGTYNNDPYTMQWDPFRVDNNDITTKDNNYVEMVIREPDPSNYDGVSAEDYDLSHVDGDQLLVAEPDYRPIVTTIMDEHQAVTNEVESLLSTHYDGMSAGDLSLADMLSTGAMLDVVKEAKSWQEAALYFRTLGLSEAKQPGIVSFDTSNVEGFSNDRTKFEGQLAWSLADEVEGNELPVGTEIAPSTYPGDIYMALEWKDDSGTMQADVVELTTPFVIEQINGGGDTLQFASRDVVTSDTSPEEAADIFKQNRESEEQARNQTIKVVVDDGGGGGWWPPDLSGIDWTSPPALVGLGVGGLTVAGLIRNVVGGN